MKRIAGGYLNWGVILCVLLIGVGCAQKRDKNHADVINLQLKCAHEAQFAGFYLAVENGYFAAENLKVNFLEGGQNVGVVDSLLSGKADFSVVSPEVVLKSRQKESAPVKAIATIYGRSAVVYAAMKSSGIQRPADFIGRSAAVISNAQSNFDFEYQFNALLKRMGLEVSQVERKPYDPTYVSFFSGEADITAAYYTGGVIHIRNKGHKINLIWPSDYGIHFYSDTLITTDQMIGQRPDLVERFLRASLKGWRNAVEDAQEAVAATLKYVKDKDPKLQTEKMAALIPLVHTGRGPVGWMEDGVWRQMHQEMVEQRILERPLGDLKEAYSMVFLQKIYNNNLKE